MYRGEYGLVGSAMSMFTRTLEKWMIHDTIALGPLLNDRFHRTPVIPPTPLQRACLFHSGGCIQPLAGACLCTYPLVLPGQCGLGVLAAHFADNDFLLGPRPCLADFALAGACKAHFVTDPVPVSWLGQYRTMPVAYTAGLAGEKFYEYDYGYGTTRARTQKRLNLARLHEGRTACAS